MKTNVGSYDAALRFVVGCVALIVANHTHSAWGLLGVLPILSAACGYCGIYAVLGIKTTACDQHEAPR